MRLKLLELKYKRPSCEIGKECQEMRLCRVWKKISDEKLKKKLGWLTFKEINKRRYDKGM